MHVLFEDDEHLVTLPVYIRRWGQVLVVPKLHVTTYDRLNPELWTRTSRLAHQAARVIERVQRPRRCDLASTDNNSSRDHQVQTSRHLHMHVIPVYDAVEQPAWVSRWGDAPEWAELLARYQAQWSACSS